MKYNKLLSTIGIISLILGISGHIVSTYILNDYPVIDFFTGLFLGLSLVLNLASLIRPIKSK
jgi:hypothetical protein